ncbi:hypothetical protein ACIBF1_28480 [Spirillospora sp. NPDC050679]
MQTEIMEVTPELAAEWLIKNERNRPLSKASVHSLAQAIKRDEWQVTHQGIAFDQDGRLIDGQHRLAAIVKAQIPVQVLVTWGVNSTAFTVMDTGRKRTGKDALSLLNEANASHLAAALRGLHLYQTQRDINWSGASSQVSNDQLLSILEAHPGMREAVQRGIIIKRSAKISVTAASVGWYVTSNERPDVDQASWCEKLISGADLSVGDPRLVLRNTMLNLASGKTFRRRDNSHEHLLYYIKAWNAWVEGRHITLLRRSPGEKMPQVTKKPYQGLLPEE